MSLRNSLKSAVARCTPLQMQHATFEENHATGHATAMQPSTANPHGMGVSGATGHATCLQLGSVTDATQANSGEKLHVAFASTCNTQPGPLTAHRVTADLIKAAMKVCDRHGDGEAARADMRQQCMKLSPAMQADLLDHFTKTYGAKQ